MDHQEKAIGLRKALALIAIVALLPLIAISAPEGPTNLTIINTTTRPLLPSQTVQAQAGNVSQLNIFAYTTTRTWQGYYGNVTGQILLGDAGGNVIYNWEAANPSGQIYASTSQVSFDESNIFCYNFTKFEGSYLNISAYEESLGLSDTSADGVNETFNMSLEYDPFYIGVKYINVTCPVTYLLNASNQSSRNTYQELMLYDNSSSNVVFASIIRPHGISGFDGNIWDFQMIVTENGHLADTQATTYYFYISLE